MAQLAGPQIPMYRPGQQQNAIPQMYQEQEELQQQIQQQNDQREQKLYQQLFAPEPQPVPVIGPNGDFVGVGVPAQ